MTAPEAVQRIIEAGGGTIVGKTRLQKTAYFLEAAGVGYGFDFNYHYYGPYSEELAVAAADASALQFVNVRRETSSTGISYSVYEMGCRRADHAEHDEPTAQRERILATLNRYDTISLELAATADFLAKNGFAEDPWKETRRRKSAKAKPETIETAKKLLVELQQGEGSYPAF